MPEHKPESAALRALAVLGVDYAASGRVLGKVKRAWIDRMVEALSTPPGAVQ